MSACESCGRDPSKGERHKATVPKPTMEELEHYSFDSICPATDGCEVEPDGTCQHGHRSWLLVLGFI